MHSHASPDRSLASGFLRSVERFPRRLALEVDGRSFTYEALAEHAARIAQVLLRHDAGHQDAGHRPGPSPPLTALFGHRSLTAFSGILGILLRGHGYVPLNPDFPPSRTRTMLERSQCRAVIVDGNAARQLEAVLEGVERPLVLLLPDLEEAYAEEWAARFPQHRILTGKDMAVGDLVSAAEFQPIPPDPDAVAYLLFTSGSTGIPKGVMVAHRNVNHFLDFVVERYGLVAEDRLSQMFDLTFDLSVFDLFAAWECGACVCCPNRGDVLLPARYIQEEGITVWFSVPSAAITLKKMRRLQPEHYPGLRVSLFCGEPLPAAVAEAWAAAAPNSIVENIYGPTELTLACTYYRWESVTSPEECEAGVVPIGYPFPKMDVLVVDEELRQVAIGEPGELLMAGPQRSLGYWNDAEKTATAFLVPPGQREVYYRTGDRVRNPLPGEPLIFLGRVDHQIKIQGYRVELGDIEAALRDAAGVDEAVVLGWPRTPTGVGGLVAFLPCIDSDVIALKKEVSRYLPAYMVPGQIRFLNAFPLNPNGKIDRKVLLRTLEEGDSVGHP